MRPQARKLPLYQVLARMIEWDPPTGEFADQKQREIKRLVDKLPSGAGWDLGTKLSDESEGDRIVLYGEFHHMDENGFYDGWTEHAIIVHPSLAYGMGLRITGRDRNDVKDYLHECFDYALRQEVWEYGQDEEEWREEQRKERTEAKAKEVSNG